MTSLVAARSERWDGVVVTRPEPEASRWVQALRDHGWPALGLPLIDIGEPQTPADHEALRHWRQRLNGLDALMFVSGAAVTHFFADSATAQAASNLTGPTRFWAPGPGTAAALRAAGVATERIDAPPATAAQFDSEALWPIVAPQVRSGTSILIVRGASQAMPASELAAGNGRDWLIRQCRAAGAVVQACVAYERRSSRWTGEQAAQALGARGPRAIWLFSSSEALAHLQNLMPGTDWRATTAVATHPRIADAARGSGFGHVVESRPTLPDVMLALESLRSPA